MTLWEEDKLFREMVAIHKNNCPKGYHGRTCINGVIKIVNEMIKESSK